MPSNKTKYCTIYELQGSYLNDNNYFDENKFLNPLEPKYLFHSVHRELTPDKPNTYHTHIMYSTPTTGLTKGTEFFLSI